MNGLDMEQTWNEKARGYSKRSELLLNTPEQHYRWGKRLQSLLENRTRLEVLDVGTGPGFLALQFARLGHRTTGIDLSKEMLRIAVEQARDMKLECSFVQGDAESLPCARDTFDVVASRNLLDSLSRPGIAFAEWLRVLKPGGKLVLMDGDWKARNVVPFVHLQTLGGGGGGQQRRFAASRQGKIQANPAAGELQKQVTMELKTAGFIAIKLETINEEDSLGTAASVKRHFQRIVITAQKPQAGTGAGF